MACGLKTWESINPPSLTQCKNVMIYYLNIESAWKKRNKMVQFEAMWRKVMRVLEMGVCASGSGQMSCR
jgi:hypothetical protein